MTKAATKSKVTIQPQPGLTFRGRQMRYNGEPADCSVSDVTGSISKGDVLTNWAVGLVVDELAGVPNTDPATSDKNPWKKAPRWEADRAYSQVDISSALAGAKAAPATARMGAQDEGKKAHAYLEAYMRFLMKIGENPPMLPDKSPGAEAVASFLDWTLQHKFKPIGIEVPFIDPGVRPDGGEWIKDHRRVGGRCDLIAEVDDAITIVDYKRNKNVYLEMYLQTAEYAAGLVRSKILQGVKLSDIQRLVLPIHPDGGVITPVPLPTKIESDVNCFALHTESYLAAWQLREDAGLRQPN